MAIGLSLSIAAISVWLAYYRTPVTAQTSAVFTSSFSGINSTIEPPGLPAQAVVSRCIMAS